MIQKFIKHLLDKKNHTSNRYDFLQPIYSISYDSNSQELANILQLTLNAILNHFECSHVWLVNNHDDLFLIESTSTTNTTTFSHSGHFSELNKILLQTIDNYNKLIILNKKDIPEAIAEPDLNHIMLYAFEANANNYIFGCALSRSKTLTFKEQQLLIHSIECIKNKIEGILTVQQYKNLAYYDFLTGLPNRHMFNKKMNNMLEVAKTHHKKIALLLLDLDDFKRINDTLGHLAGDELLQSVAHRIKYSLINKSLCEWCGEKNICVLSSTEMFCASRLGGDEFVLAFFICEQQLTNLQYLLKSFHNILTQPVSIEGRNVTPKISIGVSLYPYDGLNIKTLLKTADLALYQSKNIGKNQISFHKAELSATAEEDTRIENMIQYYIDTGDFNILFQPIIDLHTDRIIGAETLFRGNKTLHGDVHLHRIISIAEKTNLIVPLGLLILREACKQCKQCIDEGCDDIIVSVNVSPIQLEFPTFVQDVFGILDDFGFDGKHLVLEITENVFVKQLNQCNDTLNQLIVRGIQIAVDDFGTGFSSLSYIKYLPVHRLKIDISFVQQLETSIKDVEIVKAVIAMAQTLGITTTAEGVENEHQKNILKEFGCDYIQGYIGGKPMSSTEFVQTTKKVNCS